MTEITHEFLHRERLLRYVPECECGHLKHSHRVIIGCTAHVANGLCPCKEYQEKPK